MPISCSGWVCGSDSTRAHGLQRRVDLAPCTWMRRALALASSHLGLQHVEPRHRAGLEAHAAPARAASRDSRICSSATLHALLRSSARRRTSRPRDTRVPAACGRASRRVASSADVLDAVRVVQPAAGVERLRDVELHARSAGVKAAWNVCSSGPKMPAGMRITGNCCDGV